VFFPFREFITSLTLYLSLLTLILSFFSKGTPFKAGFKSKTWKTLIHTFILVGKCDDPAGRHLGRGGPANPPQKEQCRKAVRTVLRTGPGV